MVTKLTYVIPKNPIRHQCISFLITSTSLNFAISIICAEEIIDIYAL